MYQASLGTWPTPAHDTWRGYVSDSLRDIQLKCGLGRDIDQFLIRGISYDLTRQIEHLDINEVHKSRLYEWVTKLESFPVFYRFLPTTEALLWGRQVNLQTLFWGIAAAFLEDAFRTKKSTDLAMQSVGTIVDNVPGVLPWEKTTMARARSLLAMHTRIAIILIECPRYLTSTEHYMPEELREKEFSDKNLAWAQKLSTLKSCYQEGTFTEEETPRDQRVTFKDKD